MLKLREKYLNRKALEIFPRLSLSFINCTFQQFKSSVKGRMFHLNGGTKNSTQSKQGINMPLLKFFGLCFYFVFNYADSEPKKVENLHIYATIISLWKIFPKNFAQYLSIKFWLFEKFWLIMVRNSCSNTLNIIITLISTFESYGNRFISSFIIGKVTKIKTEPLIPPLS